MQKQWVIPDIHGCVKSLKALVENQIRPSKTDHLYFLGDYIDRGPDSKGVIDYLMQMKEQGFQMRTLRGNHEAFLLEAVKEEKQLKPRFFIKPRNRRKLEWYQHGGQDTMRSFGTDRLDEIPDIYFEWMRQLEYYVVLDDYVLVHAALNFTRRDPFEDKFAMLWWKDFDVLPHKIGGRKLIHGHTPVSLEFIRENITQEFPYIDLDNGVYIKNRYGLGNLLALELNSRELLVQANLDVY